MPADVYTPLLSTTRVQVPITEVGPDPTPFLTSTLAKRFEGKCGRNGYVEVGSLVVESFSAPLAKEGSLEYEVVYKARACVLAEGMVLNVVALDITKAGVRAELPLRPSPAVIFVARDHHNLSNAYNQIAAGDTIEVTVVGQRFELGDSQVAAIAVFNPPSANAQLKTS